MALTRWATHVLNGGDNGQQTRESEQISKSRLSSDCSLQLESMKSESLVIADQHAAVNTFPGLVHTARHTMGVGFTRRRCSNPGLRTGEPEIGRASCRERVEIEVCAGG